jgi:ATP-dependent Clp protease, protease subunit
LYVSLFSSSQPLQDLLTARAHYVPPSDEVTYQKQSARMSSGVMTPGSAPPDLPSLLLDSRIIYIGMPIVPQVAELVISELLWLNYAQPEKPIYLYINSIGSQQADGQALAFDTDAMAILDTCNYIRPDIHTLVIGQAFGNAALILASGKKGQRFALPHARIMTAPPRVNRSFGKAVDMMIKANELDENTETYVELLAKYTGKDKESLRADTGRNRYYTPDEAIEAGLIDRIVRPAEAGYMLDKKDYEGALKAQQGGRGGRVGSGPSADA